MVALYGSMFIPESYMEPLDYSLDLQAAVQPLPSLFWAICGENVAT